MNLFKQREEPASSETVLKVHGNKKERKSKESLLDSEDTNVSPHICFCLFVFIIQVPDLALIVKAFISKRHLLQKELS